MLRLRLALGALALASLCSCFTTVTWSGASLPGLGPGERDTGDVVLSVVLTPFALALDQLTSPVQIGVLLWEWANDDDHDPNA